MRDKTLYLSWKITAAYTCSERLYKQGSMSHLVVLSCITGDFPSLSPIQHASAWPARPDAMPEAMSLNWSRPQLICQSFTPLFNALTEFKAVTCVPFIFSSVLGACIDPGEHGLWTWFSSHSARASLICLDLNASRYSSCRANMLS